VSFLITVAVPHSKGFADNVAELKSLGFYYVPGRKCWVAECGAPIDDIATTVGEFVCENEECPFPDSWSPEKLAERIDMSCDFKLVGR